MPTMSAIGSAANIPGVISYKTIGAAPFTMPTTKVSAPTSSASTGQQGGTGTMAAFNDLLKERKGIKDEQMNVQEQQLQRMNTQKNNTAVQAQFASRDTLVNLMQQLLESSRRTASQQSRIFM